MTPLANGRNASASFGMGGDAPAPEVLPVSRAVNQTAEVEKLAKSERFQAERTARDAEARRPLFVLPAQGAFTSGFGSRWGTTHYGIDIASSKGTPIRAVTDGVVVESGPASGFGLWVRIEHKDGTISVYGHIDRSLVKEGQKVKAGQQIATMGNRGFSTGTHLHFEIWNPSGKKVDPRSWLRERGVTV